MWPALALVAGVVSMTATSDVGASLKGLVELFGLWVLPSLAVAGLMTSDSWRSRLLSAASAGSLLAAAINCIAALRLGFASGLPQVWGAADGFQGYFQVIGMAVAFPRLSGALSDRRIVGVVGWSVAIGLHALALVLTQTRGAWLAALVAAAVLGLIWSRTMAVIVGSVVVAAFALSLGADWTEVIRERARTLFQPEAGVSGFDSSLIRLALAASAWNMFRAHPLTGVGLKTFPLELPHYAPPGLPLAVQMGPDQVLTPIEGPHSTYLSLLSETGLLGAIAVTGWVALAWWAAYRWYRKQPPVGMLRRQFGASLLSAIGAIAVFAFLAEMNATGTVPLVVLLALAHTLRRARDV